MSELTAAEAFAKAGHQIPEGATLHFGFGQCSVRWFYLMERNHTYGCLYRIDKNKWSATCALPNFYPDLRNLPAKDCLDALPECVREVL